MDAGSLITSTPTGVEFRVRVIPRAKKTGIDGARGDAILIRIAAPPVDDAANEALVAFFADLLRLPRRSIRIVSGERSRLKRLSIDGTTADQIRSLVERRP
ncbi:MAG TPA: DUF167 domain-containing protein [Vicinamibacterales bacterium]|nr:DUF167 domain-containing protein [Vicinamibacterales bacterium]